MNYSEAKKLLTSEGKFYIDLGLTRILKVLEMFNNPQDKLKCIHVAGTNGKGSVCAMLESILKEAGYKTGLYTSPHIWEYTERIKFNGTDIPQNKFAYYTDLVCSKSDIFLTEFEILTVIMFLYFADKGADVVILETGLGGRLDATNVIKKNLCSVITQIDLDHTERLGNTKDKIAYEKAGIIKPNCPVITSMGYEVIRDRADELNSMLIFVSPEVSPKYTEALSLKGTHQKDNLALVLTVLQNIFPEIPESIILEGLRRVKHPCRFEYIKDKNLIIDASHNPNGITALRNNLDRYFPNQNRRYIFGCLKNKDYKQMMHILFREGDEIYLNEFDYPNACNYEELRNNCPFTAKKYTENTELKADKLNIVCGSFYMIGKMNNIKEICLKSNTTR